MTQLEFLRRSFKWSQADLAEAAGVDKSLISRLECADKWISRLQEALETEMSLSELLEEKK